MSTIQRTFFASLCIVVCVCACRAVPHTENFGGCLRDIKELKETFASFIEESRLKDLRIKQLENHLTDLERGSRDHI